MRLFIGYYSSDFICRSVKIMRLIDAGLLKENISRWLKPSKPDETEMIEVADALVSTMIEIEEQPIAFDVDKVVEQLEDMKSTYRRLRDLKDKDYLKYGYIIETLIDAIEIVKDDGGDEMIEKSMPATKNVPKERDTMSCKKAERYGYVKAICETDKGLFNRKVEEWINLTDGVILDASCGIIDGKTVFQAVIGGLRK